MRVDQQITIHTITEDNYRDYQKLLKKSELNIDIKSLFKQNEKQENPYQLTLFCSHNTYHNSGGPHGKFTAAVLVATNPGPKGSTFYQELARDGNGDGHGYNPKTGESAGGHASSISLGRIQTYDQIYRAIRKHFHLKQNKIKGGYGQWDLEKFSDEFTADAAQYNLDLDDSDCRICVAAFQITPDNYQDYQSFLQKDNINIDLHAFMKQSQDPRSRVPKKLTLFCAYNREQKCTIAATLVGSSKASYDCTYCYELARDTGVLSAYKPHDPETGSVMYEADHDFTQLAMVQVYEQIHRAIKQHFHLKKNKVHGMSNWDIKDLSNLDHIDAVVVELDL